MNTPNRDPGKVCPTCNIEKSAEEFHVDNSRKDYRCKVCQKQDDAIRHEKNRAKRLKQQRDWYQKDPEARIQAAKDWNLANPERRKATKRKNDLASYGLTQVQFDAILESQGGCCAICSGPPAGKYKIFVVDHDHATGIVRGLLCSPCNMGIGLLKDQPDRLRKAAEYLEKQR